MMDSEILPPALLKRKAVVYIRQSTQTQVQINVGAVLCFDASRLARNGRDWHHLLKLCGPVEARVVAGRRSRTPPKEKLMTLKL